ISDLASAARTESRSQTATNLACAWCFSRPPNSEPRAIRPQPICAIRMMLLGALCPNTLDGTMVAEATPRKLLLDVFIWCPSPSPTEYRRGVRDVHRETSFGAHLFDGGHAGLNIVVHEAFAVSGEVPGVDQDLALGGVAGGGSERKQFRRRRTALPWRLRGTRGGCGGGGRSTV